MSKKIELGGQSVGKMKAGWILFKESWRYFQSDKEMIFIPVVTGLLNLFLFGILMSLFFFLILSGNLTIAEEGESASAAEYLFYFCFYVIGAFTLALSQAGIAHTVYTRAHGGNATLGESLKVAFSHSISLFFWALITSTVGVILRALAERSKLIGRIVIALIGVAWSVLTYFVVPSIVLGKKSAPRAIKHSVEVFRRTWGETAVSNISLSVVFILFYVLSLLAVMGIGIALVIANLEVIALLLLIPYILLLIVVGLIQSALQGVIKTLLYIYASEGVMPPNFNPELLQKMLLRKDGTHIDPLSGTQPMAPAGEQPQTQPQFQGTFTPRSFDR